MKTRSLTIVAAVLISLCAFAQHDSARVSIQSGLYVFSYARPVAPHTILGEVSFSGKGAAYGVSVGGMMVVGNSEVHYEDMRTSLIAQAVLANREVEGIIIKGSSATLIKFDPNTPGKDIAVVDKVKGLYVFVDSKPLSGYDYICTKTCSCMESTEAIINKLTQKATNAKKNIEAIVVTFPEKGAGSADCIKFNH